SPRAAPARRPRPPSRRARRRRRRGARRRRTAASGGARGTRRRGARPRVPPAAASSVKVSHAMSCCRTPGAEPFTDGLARRDLRPRVVCCSPDVDGLVTAAAAHARRQLALSFPRDSWWVRAGAAAINIGARALRWEWRFYVHRRAAIVAPAEQEGLRRTSEP